MDTATRVGALIDRLNRVLRNEAEQESHVESTAPASNDTARRGDMIAAVLKPVHWEVLRFLGRANRFSRTPSGVTAWLGVTKGTASQSLAALERYGLIEKMSDPDDGRVVRLLVTAAGSARLTGDPLATLVGQLERSKDADLRVVEDVLESVAIGLLDERGSVRFGVCHTCAHFRSGAQGVSDHCTLLRVDLSPGEGTLLCIEHTSVGV